MFQKYKNLVGYLLRTQNYITIDIIKVAYFFSLPTEIDVKCKG